MELLKKNIHMDYRKCSTVTQMTLEDDRNIPDKNPDVSEILMQKGNVKLDEIKVTNDHVTLRGKFMFQVLYEADEWDNRLSKVSGSIPFEEQVYLEGVTREDTINVRPVIEDLTVGMINSRKINVQAVVTWDVCVTKLTDLEAPVEVTTDGPGMDSEYGRKSGADQPQIECRKEDMKVTGINISKNDIYRIKEEVELPSNMPNIEELIWESIKPENIVFKPMEEKIGISGELKVFFLFRGENDDVPVRYHSAVLPFHGEIECHGCESDMIPVITYELDMQDTEVRPDFDGENRIFGIELAMNLKIGLYHEDTISMVTDLYGINRDVETQKQDTVLQTLHMQNEGSYKVTGSMRVKNPAAHILQLMYTDADARVTDSRIVENGIEVDGVLDVSGIYITGDDEMPYGTINGMIPFRELIDVGGLGTDTMYTLECMTDDVSVGMADSEEIDVRAQVRIKAVIYQNRPLCVLQGITVGPKDYQKLEELPGMAVLLFEEGDSLWDIGKKYYLPVRKIRELNGIGENREPEPGSRILIVM